MSENISKTESTKPYFREGWTYSDREFVEKMQKDFAFYEQAVTAPDELCRNLNELGLSDAEKNDAVKLSVLYGANLNSVPQKYKTKALYRKAVYVNSESLRQVPRVFREYGICHDAVMRNPAALKYVPRNIQDADILKLADLKNHPENMDYVNFNLLSPANLLELIQNNPDVVTRIPPDILTPEMEALAVHQNGNLLQFIHRSHWTKTLEEAALASPIENNDAANILYRTNYNDMRRILNNPLFFESVKTPDSQAAILYHFPYTINDFPQTYENCMVAVQSAPDSLGLIKNQTPDMCVAAIDRNAMVYEFVKPELRTPELSAYAFQRDYRSIQFMDIQTLPQDLVCETIAKHPDVLRYVNQNTPGIIFTAVNINEDAYSYVQNKTENLTIHALRASEGRIAKNLKPEDLTPNVCAELVFMNPENLQYIPADKQLYGFAYDAVKTNPEVAKYLNPELRNMVELDLAYEQRPTVNVWAPSRHDKETKSKQKEKPDGREF